MDIKPLELKRETMFKDAVLSQAEAHSMEVIAEAGHARAKALEDAYASCEAADPVLIGKQLAREGDRSVAAISGEAHRDLLAWREGLVADLFGEVEKRLVAFTTGNDYAPWLAGRLAKHKDFTGPDGAGITLTLREEDESFAAALQNALPGASVKTVTDIRLGGVRIANGKVLWDETLDTALEEQKQAFYESGELRL